MNKGKLEIKLDIEETETGYKTKDIIKIKNLTARALANGLIVVLKDIFGRHPQVKHAFKNFDGLEIFD